MNIKQGLRTWILAQATVTSQLSTATDVYHRRAPASAGPKRIVFHRIVDASNTHRLAGGVGNLSHAFFQIDCYGDDGAQAAAIADPLRTAIDGVGPNTMMGTVNVRSAQMLDGERDGDQNPQKAGEARRHFTRVSVDLWYRRA